MHDNLIPIIIVPTIFICIAIVAVYAIMSRSRYLTHMRDSLNRERMTAMEKGINLPILEAPRHGEQKSSLKTGILVVAAGLGVSLLSIELTDKLLPIGMLVVLIGIGHLIYWFLEGKKEWQNRMQWERDVSDAYLKYLRELTNNIPQNKLAE